MSFFFRFARAPVGTYRYLRMTVGFRLSGVRGLLPFWPTLQPAARRILSPARVQSISLAPPKNTKIPATADVAKQDQCRTNNNGPRSQPLSVLTIGCCIVAGNHCSQRKKGRSKVRTSVFDNSCYSDMFLILPREKCANEHVMTLTRRLVQCRPLRCESGKRSARGWKS